jgi:hypothetical protein
MASSPAAVRRRLLLDIAITATQTISLAFLVVVCTVLGYRLTAAALPERMAVRMRDFERSVPFAVLSIPFNIFARAWNLFINALVLPATSFLNERVGGWCGTLFMLLCVVASAAGPVLLVFKPILGPRSGQLGVKQKGA